MRTIIVPIGVVAAILVGSVFAYAQTPEEWQAMLKKVEALEQKVQNLEGQLAAAKTTTPPTGEQAKEAAPAAKPADSDVKVSWKNGLQFESSDKSTKVKFGGFLFTDANFWLDEDSEIESLLGNLTDDTEIRSARLQLAGVMYDNIDFKVQYDFAGGDTDFKDAYLGLINLPVVGGIRAGFFKEPIGLDNLASAKYITFLERGLPNVFTPAENTGLMLYNAVMEDRMTWAAGVFRTTDDRGYDVEGDDEDNYSYTARITGLPWYEEDGRRLIHLGAAGRYENVDAADRYRIRERPEMHLSPYFVDTTQFAAGDVEDVGTFGLEAASVYGPFSIQGEYLNASPDTQSMSDPDFDGWYGQFSYLLTGENRTYEKKNGVFGRVSPKNNFLNGEGGWGAWELAGRYSALDLNDSDVDGGELDDITFGVNWYMNPNTRLMLNYIFADLDRTTVDDNASGIQMRFQVEF